MRMGVPGAFRRLGALLPFLATLACRGDDVPAASAFTTRDSGAVVLVEYPGALGAASEVGAWSVDDAPFVSVGGAAGDGPILDRVTDALRLDDGTLLVANAGTGEVLRFGPDRDRLEAFGGEGEGPGEFRFLYRLGVGRGDSILAFDPTLDRLTVMDRDGAVGRTSPLHREALLATLPDGTLLTERTRAVSGQAGRASGGSVRWTRIARASAEGEPLDSLLAFPRIEIIPLPMGEGRMLLSSRLFTVGTLRDATADGIVLAVAGGPEIRMFDLSGALRGVVRWSPRDRAVSDADVDAYVAGAIADGWDAEDIRHRVEVLPPVEAFPALSTLLVADDGTIWVAPFRRPGEDPPPWQALSPGGRWLGSLALPDRFDVEQIGRDFVLGIRKDALDRESVELYRLHRPEG